jgi:alkylhydroperoxidase family enzyme
MSLSVTESAVNPAKRQKEIVMDRLQEEDRPTAPLTPLLHESMVGWDVLEDRYGPLLRLVDTVLGVVPNCDRYMEIWPTSFRTYNIMVPNLLNLPVPVLGMGGPPPGVVGLSMYVASRMAGCRYCSAHSCSFAMRRGASPAKVAAALVPDRTSFTRGELAAIAVARSLARIPCELSTAERAELVDVYGERNAEWVALGAVMMGFLNKFMDSVGVELEQSVVSEVSSTMGPDWSPGKAGTLLDPAAPERPVPAVDGLRTRMRLLPLLPAAIRFDRRWQRETPSAWSDVAAFLSERTGHDFPVLERLHSRRARRSMASMLQQNLDPASSVVGVDLKVLAGAIFAEIVANERLAGDILALAAHAGLDTERVRDAITYARGDDTASPACSLTESAALALARAASFSPARTDASTIEACRDGDLSPAAIVEIVTWLSVLQMLHRLTCYVTVGD